MIEIVLKDLGLNEYSISYVDELKDEVVEGILIICKENVDIDKKKIPDSINLIYELANDHRFINNTGAAHEFKVA